MRTFAGLPVVIDAMCPPDTFYIIDASVVFPSEKKMRETEPEDVRKAVAAMRTWGADI